MSERRYDLRRRDGALVRLFAALRFFQSIHVFVAFASTVIKSLHCVYPHDTTERAHNAFAFFTFSFPQWRVFGAGVARMAPEVISSLELKMLGTGKTTLSQKVDLYSFGIIMCEFIHKLIKRIAQHRIHIIREYRPAIHADAVLSLPIHSTCISFTHGIL